MLMFKKELGNHWNLLLTFVKEAEAQEGEEVCPMAPAMDELNFHHSACPANTLLSSSFLLGSWIVGKIWKVIWVWLNLPPRNMKAPYGMGVGVDSSQG